MYKRKQYKKLQTKNESFLSVTSLRNNGSPKAGVSCLNHSGAQHLCIFVWKSINLDREERLVIRATSKFAGMIGGYQKVVLRLHRVQRAIA